MWKCPCSEFLFKICYQYLKPRSNLFCNAYYKSVLHISNHYVRSEKKKQRNSKWFFCVTFKIGQDNVLFIQKLIEAKIVLSVILKNHSKMFLFF